MPLQWASTSNSVIPPQPGSGASSVRGILGSCALVPFGGAHSRPPGLCACEAPMSHW